MDQPPDNPLRTTMSWLERLTGIILTLVLAALAWMVLVAGRPEIGRILELRHEVLLLTGLLATALLLVSLVALRGSRR